MDHLPLRLNPGEDLRAALQSVAREHHQRAAFVVAGIGSLVDARLRLAAAADVLLVPGPSEILTLSGSLGMDHAHLHMSVADAQGRVWGGHVMAGCCVRTTAELLIRCGQPMLKEDLTRYEENGFGARMTVKYAERWTYNFGRSEFMQFVTVENGIITEIEDGPRGG